MAAFASILVALGVAALTVGLERQNRPSQRISGLLLALGGIALTTFALVSLLLVVEPVHVLPGALGASMILAGAWRLHAADSTVERILTPVREDHPRGH